jgi:hypothetical protein
MKNLLIASELDWLSGVFQLRRVEKQEDIRNISQLRPQVFAENTQNGYAKIVQQENLGFEDRLLLILALAPQIAPDLLNTEMNYWQKDNATKDKNLLCGQGQFFRGILPTGAMFVYLLAGSNQSLKFEFIQQFLMQNFVTLQKKLVMLSPIPLGEPKTSATLYMPDEIIISLLAN